jgi:hypothetical protein
MCGDFDLYDPSHITSLFGSRQATKCAKDLIKMKAKTLLCLLIKKEGVQFFRVKVGKNRYK